MTTRRRNLIGMFVMLTLGAGLPFAPYPADPQPGDVSDMMFYGLLFACFGTFVLALRAIFYPSVSEVLTGLTDILVIMSYAIVLYAYIALWLA